MARTNELVWHFMDYPTSDDQVIAKTTDGNLMIAVWDAEKKVWYDIGRDWDWFGSGIACWAYVPNIPETTKQMPYVTNDKMVKSYAEREVLA